MRTPKKGIRSIHEAAVGQILSVYALHPSGLAPILRCLSVCFAGCLSLSYTVSPAMSRIYDVPLSWASCSCCGVTRCAGNAIIEVVACLCSSDPRLAPCRLPRCIHCEATMYPVNVAVRQATPSGPQRHDPVPSMHLLLGCWERTHWSSQNTAKGTSGNTRGCCGA